MFDLLKLLIPSVQLKEEFFDTRDPDQKADSDHGFQFESKLLDLFEKKSIRLNSNQTPSLLETDLSEMRGLFAAKTCMNM